MKKANMVLISIGILGGILGMWISYLYFTWMATMGWGFFTMSIGIIFTLLSEDSWGVEEEPEEDYQKIIDHIKELEEIREDLGTELDMDKKIHIIMHHIQILEEKVFED